MNKNANLPSTNKTENIIDSFEVGGFDYAEPLTPQQVSKKFFHGKVSYATVLRLAKTGELPFHKIGQKYFTWRKALEEWRDQNTSIGGDLQ